MSGVLVSVRLDADAVAEIDGRVGLRGRSGFIRDAVMTALGGPVPVLPSVPEPVVAKFAPPAGAVSAATKEKAGNEKRRLDAAAELRAEKMKMLLAALRRRSMTARQAAEELGWPEILTVKVSDKLLAAGLVHFPRGMGVMEVKG